MMTLEEKVARNNRVNEQIKKILGERPKNFNEEQRAYDRNRDELKNLADKYGEEVLNGSVLLSCGRSAEGYTPSGKKVLWYGNCGLTLRSRYCGTLVIDGKTIFTSGKLSKCYEYIHNN